MFDTNHLHPMTVHFPIALILLGFMFDLLSMFFNKKEPCLSKFGFWLMILGTLAAVAGYLTGEFFTAETTEGVITSEMFKNAFVKPSLLNFSDMKEIHEIFAKTTMFIMIAASCIRIFLVLRKKEHSKLKWLVFGLFFIAVITVSLTGLLGGSLVYNIMIGM